MVGVGNKYVGSLVSRIIKINNNIIIMNLLKHLKVIFSKKCPLTLSCSNYDKDGVVCNGKSFGEERFSYCGYYRNKTL